MAETTLPPVAITEDTKQHLARLAARRAKLDADWRDAIRKAVVDEGGSLRDVAEAAGISHTAVRFIVYGRPEK